jgi:xanthosine utilization system XapX-like protein
MGPNYASVDGIAAGTRNFGDNAMIYVQEWAPRILAAVVILLIGYLVARAVKWGVASLVNRTPLARHAHRHAGVPETAGRHPKSVGAQVGDAAFWIVILIALVLAAQPLGLAAATSPIGGMLNDFGAAIPNIIGAGLIFFVGYVVASVAKKAIEAVLTAARTEKLAEHAGLAKSDPTTLPRMVGGIVFALIIIPVAIAALDQLNIRAISDPATAMLRIILDSIPHVIAAAIILALAFVIGRFASQLLTQFLGSTGFDNTLSKLGVFSAETETTTGDTTAPSFVPSKMLGGAVFAAIIVFGLMEAFRQLNFAYGSRMMAEILTLLGSVIFGAVIIAAAVAIAKLVASVIRASGGASGELTAKIVQVAIIVLGTAIGLRFMGLADDIINLAFGLTLGAIAVAFALAFGLGGRDAAARSIQRLSGQAAEPPPAIPPQTSTVLRPSPNAPASQDPPA